MQGGGGRVGEPARHRDRASRQAAIKGDIDDDANQGTRRGHAAGYSAAGTLGIAGEVRCANRRADEPPVAFSDSRYARIQVLFFMISPTTLRGTGS